MPSTDELSPCINVCVLEYGTCKGCHRTQNEIATWKWLTRKEKLNILARLKGTSRINIIGQNGNDGDHYESDYSG